MASIYVPVRLATLIFSAVLLILRIIDLVQQLGNSYHDNVAIATQAITIFVLFIGAYGSFKHDQNYLITFALILLITFIMGFFGQGVRYYSEGVNVVLLILAVSQAYLIRRGYH